MPWALADILALAGVIVILLTAWQGSVDLNWGVPFDDNDPLISSVVNEIPPPLYGLIPNTTNSSRYQAPERVYLVKNKGVRLSTCEQYDQEQYQLHAYACQYKDGIGSNVFFFFDGRFIGYDTFVPSHQVYLSGRTGSEITVFYGIFQNSKYKTSTGESRSVTFILQSDGDCPPKSHTNLCMSPEQDQDIPPLATPDASGR